MEFKKSIIFAFSILSIFICQKEGDEKAKSVLEIYDAKYASMKRTYSDMQMRLHGLNWEQSFAMKTF